MNDPKVDLNILKISWGHPRSLRGHYAVTSGLIQNAHIELKFDMNDPKVNLNVFKYFRGHLRSLGHYEVTSGLTQNAPIKLKFDE